MAETVKLTGLKELDKKLARMGAKTGFKVLRSALMEASKPMFVAIRSNARSTGSKGFDADSTAAAMGRWTKKIHEKRTVLFLGPKNKAKKAVALWNAKHGTSVKRLSHFHLLEFGSIHGGAQPFMRPGYDEHKVSLARNFGRILAAQIEKAGKR